MSAVSGPSVEQAVARWGFYPLEKGCLFHGTFSIRQFFRNSFYRRTDSQHAGRDRGKVVPKKTGARRKEGPGHHELRRGDRTWPALNAFSPPFFALGLFAPLALPAVAGDYTVNVSNTTVTYTPPPPPQPIPAAVASVRGRSEKFPNRHHTLRFAPGMPKKRGSTMKKLTFVLGALAKLATSFVGFGLAVASTQPAHPCASQFGC